MNPTTIFLACWLAQIAVARYFFRFFSHSITKIIAMNTAPISAISKYILWNPAVTIAVTSGVI